MATRERICATAPVTRSTGKKAGDKALVPAAVRQKLGVRAGDELVFEEGNMHSVERALTCPGGYFVVTRKSGQPAPARPSARRARQSSTTNENRRSKTYGSNRRIFRQAGRS
jgi:bifunctional DNA-binding transcriptional regulator/antitoxin component of YhaV-PrlF toxin-antitoxin module